MRIFTELQSWPGPVFYMTGLFCFIWSSEFEHYWEHYNILLALSVVFAETSQLGLQLDLYINML